MSHSIDRFRTNFPWLPAGLSVSNEHHCCLLCSPLSGRSYIHGSYLFQNVYSQDCWLEVLLSDLGEYTCVYLCVLPVDAKVTCALADVRCAVWRQPQTAGVSAGSQFPEDFQSPSWSALWALLMVWKLLILYIKSLLAWSTCFLDGTCLIYPDLGKSMNWEAGVHPRNSCCIGGIAIKQ